MAKETWVSTVDVVDKPWGHEVHFAIAPGKYCGKVLHIRAGHALSLQYHERKEETIVVQSGRLRLEIATWASRSNPLTSCLGRLSTSSPERGIG